MSWIAEAAARESVGAVAQTQALCAIPSPTGDHVGAERVTAALANLLPAGATLVREESSTPGHPPDARASLRGDGAGSILLLGHLDTVVGLDAHRAPVVEGARLQAPGSYDMKGGLVIACAVFRALATRPGSFDRIELLCVADEEWRQVPLRHTTGASERYDACLCFEGGEGRGEGAGLVVARRKAAATLRIEARGVAAHSGAAAANGRSALLALADLAPALVRAEMGGAGLSVVPTVLRSGKALNSVPEAGELIFDVRAFDTSAMESILEAVPAELDGVELRCALEQRFPAMDSREAVEPVLERAAVMLGRGLVAVDRGGSSDAAFFSSHIPLTLDGLGPLGGGDHSPAEHVFGDSFEPQTAISLSIVESVLGASAQDG